MGELGIDGNNYENDTFAVRSYDWVDEDNNEWHFWHKPSGLKVQWYKYPLRGFEANMDIADDQFLDVLRDCTNSTEVGKDFKILHEVHKWWDEPQTDDLQDWKDRMWAEAIVTEPQPEVVMPKKCEGCDSASKIIVAYSRGFEDGAEAAKTVKVKALHKDYVEPYVAIEVEHTDCSWK